ncbi:DUF11 domain-containing protein, partial [Escherichia coli]|uniref:DUF11 domain-containing protein n=1 Tax=Escherichia coli TaxID=562 RepID=UPI001440E84C
MSTLKTMLANLRMPRILLLTVLAVTLASGSALLVAQGKEQLSLRQYLADWRAAVNSVWRPPVSLLQTGTTDLSITKNNGATTYSSGGTATYTVVVTNNGPSAAN